VKPRPNVLYDPCTRFRVLASRVLRVPLPIDIFNRPRSLGNRLQIHSDREGRGGIYVLVGGQTASGDVRVLPQTPRQL